MKTYVTFGQEHVHSCNGKTFDKDCVAVIEGPNAFVNREKAFALFGPKFCFEYSEDKWDDRSLKYFPRGLINVENNSEVV